MAQITAIEFSDLECRIVAGERIKNRLNIRTLISVPLPPNTDATARVNERSQLLRDALKANKLKVQRAELAIPKNYVMARVVTLPSNSEQEIRGMARFEAERHIPFNAERHIIAFHILADLGVQGSQVLLAAIDRPIAQEYLDICSKAGVAVEKLSISSFGLFNGISLADSGAIGSRVVAAVNIGNTYTDIVIANNGVVNFTRGASLGLSKLFAEIKEAAPDQAIGLDELSRIDALEPQVFFAGPQTAAHSSPSPVAPEPALADSGLYPALSAMSFQEDSSAATPAALPENPAAAAFTKWLLRLLQEVRRTYDFAHREFNCPLIEQIYLTGEGALIRNLPQYFRINFGLECVVFDPLRIADVPKKIEKELSGKWPIYAAAIGAAAPASPAAVSLNLLPEEYLEKRMSKRQQQTYIITGMLLLTALVLGYFYVSDTFTRERSLLAEYRQNNKEMKSRVEELQSKETRLNIIRKYVQERHGALDVLEKISEFPFIPERVTLTHFEYRKFGSEGDEGVKIMGHARSIADVNKMQQQLEETGYFDSVSQDPGSGGWVSLPFRSEKVISYQLTGKFKKETKTDSKKTAPSGAPTKVEKLNANK